MVLPTAFALVEFHVEPCATVGGRASHGLRAVSLSVGCSARNTPDIPMTHFPMSPEETWLCRQAPAWVRCVVPRGTGGGDDVSGPRFSTANPTDADVPRETRDEGVSFASDRGSGGVPRGTMFDGWSSTRFVILGSVGSSGRLSVMRSTWNTPDGSDGGAHSAWIETTDLRRQAPTESASSFHVEQEKRDDVSPHGFVHVRPVRCRRSTWNEGG